jgi:hypothetical protein
MATGKDIYEKALTRNGQAYIEGTLVPKNDANWGGPWDCAELLSWAVYQVAGKLYGCTNDLALPAHADAYSGAWKDDAHAKGIIITVEKAAGIVGAAVLRAPSADLGGHIVFSDGKGGTIEAKGKKWGVIQDTLANRRWDFGILVPGITYTQPGEVVVKPPKKTIYRYTNPMMVAAKVGEIQQALTKLGFSTKGIDDIFGADTRNAVMAFQRSKGLTIDGEVGPDTAAALKVSL